MQLPNPLQRVREWAEEIGSYQLDKPDAELGRMAERCYHLLEPRLGPPSDPTLPMRVIYGPQSWCAKTVIPRGYLIAIGEEWDSEALRYQAVAHEVCHRITQRRGLTRWVYIEEVIATLASLWVLEASGSTGIFDQWREWSATFTDVAPVRVLQQARRRNIPWRIPPDHPATFRKGVIVLAIRLYDICGWPGVCRMVTCRTLQEWMDTLPDNQRAVVSELMEQ